MLNDLYELTNIADAYPGTVARLRVEIKELLLRNNDRWAEFLK